MLGIYSFDENKFLDDNGSNIRVESFGVDNKTLEDTFDKIINKKTIDWSEISFDYSIVFYLDKKLYLKRDLFGNVPLYFFISKSNLYFSSELNSLTNHPDVDCKLNENIIYSYLNNYQNKNGYSQETVWGNIYSVIPGGILEFTESNINKYINSFHYNSKVTVSNNIIGEFNSLFSKQLSEKVDFSKNVSSALSGGLDSSSVSSFAQQLSKKKIKTIEFRLSDEINPERKYAQAVVEKIKSDHSIIELDFVNLPEESYYKCQEEVIKITGLLPNPYSVGFKDLRILKEIKDNNCEYFLTGQGGDDCMITRSNYLNQLFFEKKWKKLGNSFNEILKMHENYDLKINGYNYINNLLKSNILQLVSEKRIFELFKFLFRTFKLKYLPPFINSTILSIKNRISYPELYKLNYRILIKGSPSLEKKMGQLNFLKENLENENDYNYVSELFRPQAIKNREQSYLLGKKFGVKYVYPFYDLKLIEFISRTPKEIIFCYGFGRGLLRKSGLLPTLVENRVNKTVFKHYHLGVLKQLYPIFLKKMGVNHKIWDYVFEDKFVELGNKLINFTVQKNHSPQNYNIEDVMGLIRVIYLGIWLDICHQKQLKPNI